MSSVPSVKIVLLGATEVGKTSIASRYGMGSFDSQTQSTIGVAFFTKTLHIGEEEIQLEIWDTAGQEKFKSVTMSYLRQARAVLCIYDLSKPDTVRSAFDYAMDSKGKVDNNNTIIAIVGNKSDLCENVPDGVGPKTEENNFLSFTCSAKTGENVDNIFSLIAKDILRARISLQDETIPPIKITKKHPRRKACC